MNFAKLLICFGTVSGAMAQTGPNLLLNGGFETPLGTASSAWSVNAADQSKGTAIIDATSAVAGKTGLHLLPNHTNPISARTATPFGVGQGIRTAGLLGKKVTVSAWMSAQGEANAILRIYAIGSDGSATLQVMLEPASVGTPALRRDVFQVPTNPSTFALIILCQVEGNSGSASFDEVSVVSGVPATWNEAQGNPDTGAPYTAQAAIDAQKVVRNIPSTLFGTNLEWTWDGNGVWDASHNTLNTPVAKLATDTGFTLYRFPGAAFADFYHWKDGVGAQNTRPTNSASPQGPISKHRFGTDEALSLASQNNGSLIITVNVLTGTAAEAADWVRYVNSSSHKVVYWEVGNENYVPGQSSLSPEEYATRFVQFSRAMKAADPTIQIGAIGDENFSFTAVRQYPDWTARVMNIAANDMDFLSVHCAYTPMLAQDLGWNSRTVYAAALGAPVLIAHQLADIAKRLQALAPGRTNPIQIAVTEWGPYFQTDPNSRFFDHSKTLASALSAASTLKVFIENPNTKIANMFKLVDPFAMGWIGLKNGVYTAKASLMAMKMFHDHLGPQMVSTQVVSPTFDSPAVGWTDGAGPVPFLDMLSSKSADGKKLYVIAINKNLDRAIQTTLQIQNFTPAATANVYTLNGTAADANTGTDLPVVAGNQWAAQATIGPNSRFANGAPNEVTVATSSATGISQTSAFVFPAHSITAIEFVAK